MKSIQRRAHRRTTLWSGSRPIRRALSGLAVCAVGLLAAPPAAACSCIPTPTHEEALGMADAVFTGTVESVEEGFRETQWGRVPEVRVVLSLDRVWKGGEAGDDAAASPSARALGAGERVDLVTGTGGGDCGFPFEEGETYLVYASSTERGPLTAGICTRTRPFKGTDEELSLLGPPERVVTRERG